MGIMSKMKTIIFHTYIGYLGDQATNWWTEKDWAQYRKEIERMEEEGVYGRPITLTFKLKQFSFSNTKRKPYDYKGMGVFIPIKKK
jgi:hypothetical protein